MQQIVSSGRHHKTAQAGAVFPTRICVCVCVRMLAHVWHSSWWMNNIMGEWKQMYRCWHIIWYIAAWLNANAPWGNAHPGTPSWSWLLDTRGLTKYSSAMCGEHCCIASTQYARHITLPISLSLFCSCPLSLSTSSPLFSSFFFLFFPVSLLDHPLFGSVYLPLVILSLFPRPVFQFDCYSLTPFISALTSPLWLRLVIYPFCL